MSATIIISQTAPEGVLTVSETMKSVASDEVRVYSVLRDFTGHDRLQGNG